MRFGDVATGWHHCAADGPCLLLWAPRVGGLRSQAGLPCCRAPHLSWGTSWGRHRLLPGQVSARVTQAAEDLGEGTVSALLPICPCLSVPLLSCPQVGLPGGEGSLSLSLSIQPRSTWHLPYGSPRLWLELSWSLPIQANPGERPAEGLPMAFLR